MRIAASNIAWDVVEDDAVAALLRHHAVDAIDTAPAKYFPEPARAGNEAIQLVRASWADRGFEITGMQALLFGTTGLNVFGAPEVQKALLAHLAHVCRIGSGLGAKRLVFGSPKNRDRAGLSDAAAHDVALAFFGELGVIASEHGVLICLEPNPPRYGANFMCNSRETAKVVAALAHPAIRMQLDTGAMQINSEDPREVVELYGQWVGHVHASEPDLVPLGDGGTEHSVIGALLAQRLPDQVVSIEMVATKNEPHLVSLERAVQVAVHNYRAPAAEPS